jgi:hypothetical protein
MAALRRCEIGGEQEHCERFRVSYEPV